jgi:N-methylhydantoinase A
MREVQIGQALIPPYPGVTSALGCLLANFRHDFVRTVSKPLMGLDLSTAYAILADQAAQGARLLEEESASLARTVRVFEADMAYEGQIHAIRVAWPEQQPASVDALRQVFEHAYRREYGHTQSHLPIVVVNLRTTLIAQREKAALGATHQPTGTGDARLGHRNVFFEQAYVSTPVYLRDRLAAGTRLPGPCIVEQADTTIVVEPGMEGAVDAPGNIVIRRSAT